MASAHVGWRGHPELVLLDLLVPAVHRVAPAQLLDVRRAAGPIRGDQLRTNQSSPGPAAVDVLAVLAVRPVLQLAGLQ